MSPDALITFLLWSLAANYFVLMLWFGAWVFARPWLRRVHGRWFRLSDDTFEAIHYAGMAVLKIGIFLFNLAPLFALWMMGSNP